MKKLIFTFILLLMIHFCAICEAAIDLPWSSTFNCSEWTTGQGLNCDGLLSGGGWTCNGTPDQITSAANYPNGGGGKGLRHWKGDGSNVNGGGISLYFNQPQPELWIRWYMRYQNGFKWSSLTYDKLLYIHTSGNADVVPLFMNADQVRLGSNNYGHYDCSNCGWATMFGVSSDGSWHCYELHIKMDTNGSNGIAELWIDGVKKISVNTANWGTYSAGWSWFLIGSNQATPDNGGCMAQDFDDIAVSNTGYIGLISSTRPTHPLSIKAE